MKKTFRHTGVLMMVGVFALGLLGAAYTLWYEDLTLEAQIDTGVLDVDWSLEGNDPGEGPSTHNGEEIVGVVTPNGTTWHLLSDDDDNVPDSKFTQSCTGTLPADDTGDDNGTNSTLVLNLTGLYPYAGCEFTIDIHNDGTVPVHFTSNQVITTTGGLNPEDVSASFAQCTVSDANGVAAHPADLAFDANGLLVYGAGVPTGDWEHTHGAGDPVQLHTSGRIECKFRVWLEQSADENSSVTVSATIRGHQWNENGTGNNTVPLVP